MQQLPLGVRLSSHASFATFVDAGNGAAVAAMRALAAGRPGVAWLAGAPSSGRTHLLLATCAAADPDARIGYLEGPALRTAGADNARAWAGLDVLCIDDVDALVGDLALEKALFSLYRDLDERGGRLAVAAEAPPGALRWALPDIASRFAAASLFVLRPLDEAQQVEALRRHAQVRGLELPDDVARYLQRRTARDMRALCDLLDRLDAAALAAQRRLTVPFVRDVLVDAPTAG
jgi:DnaA family protein